MDKGNLSVIRLILKILRFAVIIGFIALTAMTLRNGQEFGSMPLSGMILIRAVGELIHNRFESDVYARSVTEPVLIIASEDDEVISFRHSRRLGECFDRAGFIAVKNAGHNDIPDLEETKDAIRAFLGRGTVK